MARTLLSSNLVFFLVVLCVLGVFFYNIANIGDRIGGAQELTYKITNLLEEKQQLIKQLTEQLELCTNPNHTTYGRDSEVGYKRGKNSAAYANVTESIKTAHAQDCIHKKTSITIPVLVISCNRADFLRQTLTTLLKDKTHLTPFRIRPSDNFPVIVSQDCDDQAVDGVLSNEFEEQITVVRHSKKPEKKLHGYSAVAEHYSWALTQVFNKLSYDAVIILEDDMEISVDFFEYFVAVYPLLLEDPTIYCASSWNDNGQKDLIKDPTRLYRTDIFPGLGWMLTRSVWEGLRIQWNAIEYWDEFMRKPEVRQNRVCIRPDISRNRNIGNRGISSGQFYDKFIKPVIANTKFVGFTKMDLSYLRKENYDKILETTINNATITRPEELLAHRVPEGQPIRLIYDGIPDFKRIAQLFRLMDDVKEGRPRTSYRMVVPFYFENRQVYLTPPNIPPA